MYLKPCTDKPQLKENLPLEIIEHTTHHQDSDFDGCSPFCNCSCCSVRVVSTLSQNSSSIPQNIAFKYPLRIKSKLLKASIAIWQPPKFI